MYFNDFNPPLCNRTRQTAHSHYPVLTNPLHTDVIWITHVTLLRPSLAVNQTQSQQLLAALENDFLFLTTGFFIKLQATLDGYIKTQRRPVYYTFQFKDRHLLDSDFSSCI